MVCPPTVACSMGTFYHAASGSCIVCNVGTYQDEEGQLECKRCPQPDEHGALIGARNINECGGSYIIRQHGKLFETGYTRRGRF